MRVDRSIAIPNIQCKVSKVLDSLGDNAFSVFGDSRRNHPFPTEPHAQEQPLNRKEIEDQHPQFCLIRTFGGMLSDMARIEDTGASLVQPRVRACEVPREEYGLGLASIHFPWRLQMHWIVPCR